MSGTPRRDGREMTNKTKKGGGHEEGRSADNTAEKQRGRPFKKGQSGNPAGKPKGARNRSTVAAELLLDGESGELTRKMVELAKAGDTTALRLCLERILPPRKDRPVSFPLPRIESAEDADKAMAAIVSAVASGELTPIEARDVSATIQVYLNALENSALEARIAAIEKQGPRPGGKS